MKTKSVEALLRQSQIELSAGQRLLAEKKRAKKKAKGALERRNASRSAEIVENAVESIAEHRELLKRTARSAPEAEGG